MSDGKLCYRASDKNIIFDLKPDIYTAFPESAEGKTYTLKLLKALIALGNEDILALSYYDVKGRSEEYVCSLINEKPYNLIFLDRADLYATPAIFDALLKSSAIVYLDCKHNNYDHYVCGVDCSIEFKESEIRYYVDAL